MNSINSVVNEKVENGSLNKDSMVNEAQGLYQDMGTNPMFKAMQEQQTTIEALTSRITALEA